MPGQKLYIPLPARVDRAVTVVERSHLVGSSGRIVDYPIESVPVKNDTGEDIPEGGWLALVGIDVDGFTYTIAKPSSVGQRPVGIAATIIPDGESGLAWIFGFRSARAADWAGIAIGQYLDTAVDSWDGVVCTRSGMLVIAKLDSPLVVVALPPHPLRVWVDHWGTERIPGRLFIDPECFRLLDYSDVTGIEGDYWLTCNPTEPPEPTPTGPPTPGPGETCNDCDPPLQETYCVTWDGLGGSFAWANGSWVVTRTGLCFWEYVDPGDPTYRITLSYVFDPATGHYGWHAYVFSGGDWCNKRMDGPFEDHPCAPEDVVFAAWVCADAGCAGSCAASAAATVVVTLSCDGEPTPTPGPTPTPTSPPPSCPETCDGCEDDYYVAWSSFTTCNAGPFTGAHRYHHPPGDCSWDSAYGVQYLYYGGPSNVLGTGVLICDTGFWKVAFSSLHQWDEPPPGGEEYGAASYWMPAAGDGDCPAGTYDLVVGSDSCDAGANNWPLHITVY
ncbi:MAG: hypothetical protein ABIH03_10105 [Pseudomonadota bacterium]